MRTIAWESSAGALAAFLNTSTQVYMADLFTITLSGGTVLRYTSADTAVTVNAVGIAVDNLDLSINADASITVSGVPIIAFIAAGGFDNAIIGLSRSFAAGPTNLSWIGVIDLFQGRVSDTDASRYEAQITVTSDSELLNVMIPRNVYAPGCSNTLFDGTCGVSKAAFSATITATSTDGYLTTTSATMGQPATYYALGWAVGVTGANAGVGRTIKSNTTTSFMTIQPWGQPVAPGDTFKVYAGCDKTQATCNSKFANLPRFRGYPFVPAAETVT
jgi:uncharacterized phage protein (TIGR02218 family)